MYDHIISYIYIYIYIYIYLNHDNYYYNSKAWAVRLWYLGFLVATHWSSSWQARQREPLLARKWTNPCTIYIDETQSAWAPTYWSQSITHWEHSDVVVPLLRDTTERDESAMSRTEDIHVSIYSISSKCPPYQDKTLINNFKKISYWFIHIQFHARNLLLSDIHPQTINQINFCSKYSLI